MSWVVKAGPDGVAFKVRVVPRAGRSEVAGLQGDALRVRLAAAPVEGAANEECRALLADVLGVSKGRVIIVSGARSREKVVKVLGMDEAALRAALAVE